MSINILNERNETFQLKDTVYQVRFFKNDNRTQLYAAY